MTNQCYFCVITPCTSILPPNQTHKNTSHIVYILNTTVACEGAPIQIFRVRVLRATSLLCYFTLYHASRAQKSERPRELPRKETGCTSTGGHILGDGETVSGLLWPAHLRVSSRMNISQALAKSTGASAEIILTSSSHFMMRLMRASGRSLWFLKSCSVPMSSAFICVCMPGSSNGSGSGGGDSGQKDKAGKERD